MISSTLGIGYSNPETLATKYLNSASEFIEVDGLTVHYRKEGSGEPLVLLHGVLSSLHTWDAWAEQLSQDYTVYRFDLPGFGFSMLPAKRDLYVIDSAIEFMHKLFDAFALQSFHIAGNSLGGYLAWQYTAAFPSSIRSLCVVDPVSYAQKLPWVIALGSHPLFNPFIQWITPQSIFNQCLGEVYGKRSNISLETQQRYFDLTSKRGNKRSMAYIFRMFRSQNKDPKLGDPIASIKAPTLVMWGQKDRWVPPEFAQGWQRDVPHAQIKLYPELGHVPMEEAPHATVKDFSAFLKALD